MNSTNTVGMRWLAVLLAVTALMVAPMGALADAGRAAPDCITMSAQNLQPTMDIDGDVCVIVALGTLQPGDVYAMNIIVVDDAIDLLFFDENGLQPYELGQSYRASMAQPASTESALGAFEFHWKVPPSISAKQWYMVLDNQAHDGDAGQGDQGGARSTVSASVTAVNQAYWTPFNNLVGVDTGGYEVLLSGDDLRLDAGTIVVVSAWDLESVGDVYLQTRTMHDRYVAQAVGVQYIDGGDLQAVASPRSLTWQVPSSLEGEELLLVVDNTDTPLGGGNGSQDLRMTVRLELAPPLTPVVNDDQSGTVSIGESVRLDASLTPNRLGQQGTFSWDLDANVDSNGDGNDTNDVDATGLSLTTSWDAIGVKTITVQMTAPSGEVASTTHQLTVVDTEDPVAKIQTNAVPVSGGWRVDVNTPVTLNCASSSDDDAVAGCSWVVDGEEAGTNTTLSFTWDEVGEHTVVLTVTDPSGNTGTSSATIRSIDPSIPSVSPVNGTTFPTTATQGDRLSFTVVVNDNYDTASSLRVHWDLQPTIDTDGNGDPKDDPDRTGLSPTIAFDRTGQQDIVVTVFDGSNNSDSFAFSVTVSADASATSSPAMMLGGLLVVLLLVGAGLFGFRFYQRRLALDMLLNRDLSVEEAKAHMALVAQKTRFPLLAKAEAYAGLDQGEVRPQAEREAMAKQAEFDSIYGATESVDQTTAFAPPAYASVPMSQASSQAAAEAAALLSDDGGMGVVAASSPQMDALSALMDEEEEVQETVTEPAPTAGVSMPEGSGGVSIPSSAAGVALPASTAPPPTGGGVALPTAGPEPTPAASAASPTPPPAPAPALVRHTCSACQAVFEIDMPAGLNEALVGCPGCGVDQHVRLGA